MRLAEKLPPMPLRVSGWEEYDAWTQSLASALWGHVLESAEAKAGAAGYRLHPEDQAWLSEYLPAQPATSPAGLGELAVQFETLRVHQREVRYMRLGVKAL